MNIGTQIVWLLFAHWVGDFVLQSDRIAKGKSKSNEVLLEHVVIYTLVMLLASFSVPFAILNGLIHFAVDWVTSRASSRLWAQGRIHEFFVVLGLDQFIHDAGLIALAVVLLQ